MKTVILYRARHAASLCPKTKKSSYSPGLLYHLDQRRTLLERRREEESGTKGICGKLTCGERRIRDPHRTGEKRKGELWKADASC